jgi:UDP-2-acetamido-2-deoxy-ribo-hexuluronate aminotransferase
MQFTDLKTQYRALKADIDARIHSVLEHGKYIMGPEVPELELQLAGFAGVKHCITVASGTEALLISLMALGVRPGDEVITTPFTFAATAEVICLAGAVPVFVDIDPATFLIQADHIEEAITPRTRAIMPVSLYGQVADMDRINSIAAANGGIPVIEDAAQSFGATYKGRRSCSLSTLGCTSFFPSKPLGCYGDGGAIFTSDDELAEACRQIRVHGQRGRYNHVRVGVGGRMDTIQCAVVLAKLPRFEWELQRRRYLGDRYHQLLSERGCDVDLLRVHSDRDCIWAQYTVALDRRDDIAAALSAAAVPTAIHYPQPLNRQPAYRGVARGGVTPHADQAATRVLSLPMSADLTEQDQERVVAELARVVGAA